MNFSQLKVGQFYMYPLAKVFQNEYSGIWMRILDTRFASYGEVWNICAVCVYGENVGKMIDHEKDPLWNNTEVILVERF